MSKEKTLENLENENLNAITYSFLALENIASFKHGSIKVTN